jgi:hypothetical protein
MSFPHAVQVLLMLVSVEDGVRSEEREEREEREGA